MLRSSKAGGIVVLSWPDDRSQQPTRSRRVADNGQIPTKGLWPHRAGLFYLSLLDSNQQQQQEQSARSPSPWIACVVHHPATKEGALGRRGVEARRGQSQRAQRGKSNAPKDQIRPNSDAAASLIRCVGAFLIQGWGVGG